MNATAFPRLKVWPKTVWNSYVWARKEAVRHFARLFINGNMPSHEDILAIKGVGPWTLDYLEMRGERNPDIYLGGDLIVRKMAQQYPIAPEKAAPWRSYLTLQLWQLSNQ